MSVQGIGSRAAATFHHVIDYKLFNRVNLVFAAAIAIYSLPRLYSAYQCYQHTSTLLDDPLKLCRCKMLFEDANLEQCMGLLDSMRPSEGKDAMMLKMVKGFLDQKNAEKAFACANKLRSPSSMLEAFDVLVEHATTPVYQKQLNTMLGKAKVGDNIDYSAYAIKYHKVGNAKEAHNCAETAYANAAFEKTDLKKLQGVCKAAIAYDEIGDETSCDEKISDAQKLMNKIKPEHEDYFEAHLALAKAYYQIGVEEADMDAELDILIGAKNRTSGLIKLLTTIREDENVSSKYDQIDLKTLSDEIKREEINQFQRKFFHAMSELPETTDEEKEFKMHSLMAPLQHDSLINAQNMTNLVQVFDQLTDDQKAFFGSQIVVLYNKGKLEDQAREFTNKYSAFAMRRPDVLNLVLNTVSEYAPQNQNEIQLMWAEGLLDKMGSSSSEYNGNLAKIIDAYLNVDNMDRARILLNQYENGICLSYAAYGLGVAAVGAVAHHFLFQEYRR